MPGRSRGQQTYEGVAGPEGGVAEHVQAARAVAGGAVDVSTPAVADVAGGVGQLPAVNEHCRVLALAQCGPIGQSQVIGRTAITAAWPKKRGKQN